MTLLHKNQPESESGKCQNDKIVIGQYKVTYETSLDSNNLNISDPQFYTTIQYKSAILQIDHNLPYVLC